MPAHHHGRTVPVPVLASVPYSVPVPATTATGGDPH